jgi:hypothetical protein
MRSFALAVFIFSGIFLAEGQNGRGTSFVNSSHEIITEDVSGNLYVAGKYTGTLRFDSFQLKSEVEKTYIARIDPFGKYLWLIDSELDLKDMAIHNTVLYLAGSFSGSVILNGINYTADNTDAILVSYDQAGKLNFAKQYQGPGKDIFNSFSVSTSGQLCLTGETEKGFDTGATAVSKGGFVLRTDMLGKPLNSFSVNPDCIGREIGTDIKGNIYILCGYANTVSIGANTFHPSDQGSHLILRYSPAGLLHWVKDLGGNYYTSHENLTVKSNGDFYLSKEQRYGSILLKKFSGNGDLIWTKKYGGSVYDECNLLSLDKNENLCMKGKFWYSASFGGLSAKGTGNCNYFVKLDPEGKGIWIESSDSEN